MRKTFLIAAAALLASVTASYAATQGIGGFFSLTYTPTKGAAGNMSFSSAPGDGSVCGTNPATCDDLGTQSMSGQSVTNNPFYIDGTTHTGQLTLPSLTIGTAFTTNFFTANPAGSCGDGPTNCVTSMNAGGIVGSSSTTDITYGVLTASFNFNEPSGATGATSFTGTYAANYNGSLTCGGTVVPSQADCITWNAPDPLTVNFTDGAVMTVTLNPVADWAITSTVTFKMTQGPSGGGGGQGVPEPASLALFGTAVAGLGLMRRRRKAA